MKTHHHKARTLAIMNMRGGCAKTTNAVHLGLAAARMGNRVLMVDLDQQAHLTASIAIEGQPIQYIDEAMAEKRAKPTVTKTENLHLLPSRLELATFLDSGAVSRPRWEEMLLKALDPVVSDYDFVVIDTPATFSPKSHPLALRAADSYVISLRPEAFSVLGYDESRNQVELFKEQCEISKPHFIGYILSGVPKSRRKAVERIREGLGAETDGRSIEIPLDVAFDEARWSDGSVNRSIFDFPGTEELQAAYLEASGKIMKWMMDVEEGGK